MYVRRAAVPCSKELLLRVTSHIGRLQSDYHETRVCFENCTAVGSTRGLFHKLSVFLRPQRRRSARRARKSKIFVPQMWRPCRRITRSFQAEGHLHRHMAMLHMWAAEAAERHVRRGGLSGGTRFVQFRIISWNTSQAHSAQRRCVKVGGEHPGPLSTSALG
jgi:hypothetical protein